VNSTSPLVSKANADQFNILVQLYQAKQDGNNMKVMEPTQQMGLPGGSGKHKMSRKFGSKEFQANFR